MEGQCLSDEFAKCDLGPEGEVQMEDAAGRRSDGGGELVTSRNEMVTARNEMVITHNEMAIAADERANPAAEPIDAQWGGRSLYGGRRPPHRGRRSYRGKKPFHSKAPQEGTNDTANMSKLCELKEYSQLGEHRNSVIANFNDLYGAKGRTITKSLMEIFHLNEDEEIMLFITQKFLHIYGLCVPCFKFSSPNSVCSNNIRCKWCHHYSHTDTNSSLHPHKMLHMRSKCKVCSYLSRDGFCFLQNECHFCHSVEHLPSRVRQTYFHMLNDLYEKKKHTDVITKELLCSLQKGKTHICDLNIFATMEKELMCVEDDIQGGGPIEGGADTGAEEKRNKVETCPECDSQGKRPCRSYFLIGKTQTSCAENGSCVENGNCAQNGDCPDCHSEVHKKKNSNLYFMTYLHDRNMCQVCPHINEEKCPCEEDSAYCHDTDHISYGVKMKNVLGVCAASLRGEFSDERQPGNAPLADVMGNQANVTDSVSINAESTVGTRASNLSRERQDHRRSHRVRSSAGRHARPPNVDVPSSERKRDPLTRSTQERESSKRYLHSRSHSRRGMHRNDRDEKKNDKEMGAPPLGRYTKEHAHHLGSNFCEKGEERRNAEDPSDLGTQQMFDRAGHRAKRPLTLPGEADFPKGEEEQNASKHFHHKVKNNSSAEPVACTEGGLKGESKSLITGENPWGEELRSKDGCNGAMEEGTTNPQGREVKGEEEHLGRQQEVGSHIGSHLGSYHEGFPGSLLSNEYNCDQSSVSTNVEKGSNHEGGDGCFGKDPLACTSQSNKRVDSLTTQEAKYHLNDLHSLSQLALDDVRSFHDEGPGEEDIEIEEVSSRVKIIQDVPTHNAQRPRGGGRNASRGVSKDVSRDVSRDISKDFSSGVSGVSGVSGASAVSGASRASGDAGDVRNRAKGIPRSGQASWNHVAGKTWRKQRMMTGEMTGAYSLEEHDAGRCVPCAFYFSSGCNYSLHCRNCHHEEHRNSSSYMCHYRMLHRMRKCKPCVDYFRGTCRHNQTGTPREMDQCAYCHHESHRRQMERMAKGRARKGSISSQSSSGSKRQWRSSTQSAAKPKGQLGSATRSAAKPRGQLRSSSLSTLEPKSRTRSSSLSTLASKQKFARDHRSPSGVYTKMNSKSPNKSALSDSHKKLTTPNGRQNEEKAPPSSKREDEGEDSKAEGPNCTLPCKGEGKNASNGTPISTKEEKEATDRRTPKGAIIKNKGVTEDNNWRSVKDATLGKGMPNGRYREARHIRKYSTPERASSGGSSQVCSRNERNRGNHRNRGNRGNCVSSNSHSRAPRAGESAWSSGGSQPSESQSDAGHRTDSPHPGESEKKGVLTKKEEVKSWRRKEEPIKQGTHNLSSHHSLLSRHEKGACHPCVYYFIGFYGCSNGRRCLNCHHEDHRNPHTLFHPSRLLHVKKLCVPCANYFKGECTRPMHACVYCHDESHAGEASWGRGDGANGGDASAKKGLSKGDTTKKGRTKEEPPKEEISKEDLPKEKISEGKISDEDPPKANRETGKHFYYVKQVGYRERDAHDRGVCHPCTFFFSGNNGCLKRNRCPNCHNREHADIHSSYHPSKLLHYKGICYPCVGHMKGTCRRRSYECVYCHNEEHLSEDRKDQMRKVIDSVNEKMKGKRRDHQKVPHEYTEK
ncbi:centrosomal protein CEP120, putative [Plasmodium vivax]|uniref:Centrosomal protein CEP120, putative n=1 Tax=Plasmodium vivax TaxID=5855 RepID=A0A1G4HEH3_PLAVI|nr:centrosomal protein CEP120, putative [Plasmodium vivax]